jgi:hypothetical protein
MPSSTATANRFAKLTALKPFKSGAMVGTRSELLGRYTVTSYDVTIAEATLDGAVTYYNPRKYSQTTSTHQGAVVRAWGLSGGPIGKQY